jgi:hypothetical protein
MFDIINNNNLNYNYLNNINNLNNININNNIVKKNSNDVLSNGFKFFNELQKFY